MLAGFLVRKLVTNWHSITVPMYALFLSNSDTSFNLFDLKSRRRVETLSVFEAAFIVMYFDMASLYL